MRLGLYAWPFTVKRVIGQSVVYVKVKKIQYTIQDLTKENPKETDIPPAQLNPILGHLHQGHPPGKMKIHIQLREWDKRLSPSARAKYAPLTRMLHLHMIRFARLAWPGTWRHGCAQPTMFRLLLSTRWY